MTHIIEFPFHIGDFLSGTMHMDATEIGAYMMLIIAHYQAGEDGLPDDDKKLAMIAKVSPKVWKRIKSTIIEKFELQDHFWRHKKVVLVLRKVADLRAQNKSKSLKRWNTGNAAASSGESRGNPNHKPITNIEDTNVSSITPIPPKEPAAKSRAEIGMLFERVWNAYPGRGKNGQTGRGYNGNKQQAMKSFAKIINETKEAEHETIIGSIVDGCEEYRKYLDENGYCSKHLSTWLNNRGWEDDYGFSRSNGSGRGTKGYSSYDALQAVLAEIDDGCEGEKSSDRAPDPAMLRLTGHLREDGETAGNPNANDD